MWGAAWRRACAPSAGPLAGTCHHVKGEIYDGKLCFTELREPTDAYEWSFVAVPAQRDAGVLKRYGGMDRERIALEREAALGRRYMKSLRREVARLAMLADETVPGEVWSSVVEKLEEPELQALKYAYEHMAAKRFPRSPSCGAYPPVRRRMRRYFWCNKEKKRRGCR